ncbi:hypothetical protein GPALN_003066 [Globodera pallida]|nr:hypothetical protein GPALN_003066 [Globodera pallida]
MSICVMFQIGTERLMNVLFPIWSMQENSKRFHAVFLLFSLCSNCYLIWLLYDMSRGVNKMVMCTPADVSALGGNENFSKSIFRSLLFLVVLEMVGWIPIVYLSAIIQKLQLSPVTGTYLSAAFTTISSCITADLFRDAINAILVDVGIKNGGNRQANTTNSVVVVPINGNLISRE